MRALNHTRKWHHVARLLWLLPSLALLIGGLHAAAPTYQPVNLSAFVNDKDDFVSRSLMGTQSLDGIPFAISGSIQLTGMELAARGEFRPDAVRNIAVTGNARRIHLLLGAQHGRKDGTPLANVILRYKDGGTRTVRLSFGIHTGNITLGEDEPRNTPLADPNSRIVWRSIRGNTAWRTYRAVFENPQPTDELVGIDLVSLFSRATPLFYGITLENGDAPALLPLPKTKLVERAGEWSETAYRRELLLQPRAAGGQPVPNATATVHVANDARTFFFGEYESDSSGNIRLPYSPQETVALHIRVNGSGFAPSLLHLSALDGKPFPEQLPVNLERGIAIGGVVTDTTGQPVAGASIIPFALTQVRSNEFTRRDLDSITTSSDGKWVGHTLESMLGELHFEVAHPDHHSALLQIPANELKQASARTALVPHVRINGQVVDANGKPIPDATVILDDDAIDRVLNRTTDTNGQFSFIIRNAAERSAHLIARAENFAPVRQSVPLNKVSNGLKLALKTGTPFTMRLVEGKDRGVPGVKVSLQRWEGSQAIQWTTETDETGRFTWTNAPDGDVAFRFEKSGYSAHSHSMTLPARSEISLNYNRIFRIAGRVLDAKTKDPIESFRVRVRYSYENGSGSTTSSGRRGSLNVLVSGGTANRDYTEVTLELTANDYETLTVKIPPPYGSTTNDYQLQPVKKLELTILSPSGAPVPNADVVLLDPRQSAYMDEPGILRRNSNTESERSDDKGVVMLAPRPEADFLVASHPQFGFVEMPWAEAQKAGKIQLKPWGHVKGVLRVGDKVEPNQFVGIHTYHQPENYDGERNVAPLYIYYRLKPEADGRFHCDAVPPGRRMVQLRYYSTDDSASSAMRLSHNVSVDVRASQTNDVIIGGTGRTVTGKVQFTGPRAFTVDAWQGEFYLRSVPRAAASEIPPPFSPPPNATIQQRQQLMRDYQEQVRMMRDRARTNRPVQQTFQLIFDTNNTFKVPSVPAGKYTLHINPYDRSNRNGNRSMGYLNQTVAVPEGTDPFDLGTFSLEPRNR